MNEKILADYHKKIGFLTKMINHPNQVLVFMAETAGFRKIALRFKAGKPIEMSYIDNGIKYIKL